MELESKAVSAPPQSLEVKEAFEDFLRAFEGFKAANDERLAGLERRSGDVLSEEKVERINRVLEEQKQKIDELTLAAARPALGGERKADTRELREKKAAFDRYVRKGDAAGLDAMEV